MANPEYSLLERNRIANNLFGGVDFEIRAYSDIVSDTGTGGTEITVAGYSPIAVANDATNFPPATDGSRANAVEFAKNFTAAATIVSIGIFAAVSGDFLARKILDAPLTIAAGESFRFPVGSFTFAAQNITTGGGAT